MNQGAKRLQELFPLGVRVGDVMRLAEACGVDWSVASRWRSGERKPIAKFRVVLLDLYGIALADWDAPVVCAVVEPVVIEQTPESEPEPEPEPTPGPQLEPERPRSLRSLTRLEPAYAKG